MAAVNAMVIVKNNDINSAIKLLKKKLKDNKTFVKYEEHLSYEKPSVKRKRKKQKALRAIKYESKLMDN